MRGLGGVSEKELKQEETDMATIKARPEDLAEAAKVCHRRRISVGGTKPHESEVSAKALEETLTL